MYGNTKICRKTLYFRKYCTSVHVHVLAGGGGAIPGFGAPGNFGLQYSTCTTVHVRFLCTVGLQRTVHVRSFFCAKIEYKQKSATVYNVLSYTRTDDEGTFEDRYLRTRYNGTCVYCTFVRRYESTFVLPYEDRQNTFVHR